MRERERKQAEERFGVCDDTGVGGQRSSCICARTLGTSDDFGKKTKNKAVCVYVRVGVCKCVCVLCTINAQFYDRPDSAKCGASRRLNPVHSHIQTHEIK